MKNKKKAVQILIEQAFKNMREQERLKEISVVALCQQANVSHASFYHYYEDIYDLNQKIEKEDFVLVMKKLLLGNDNLRYSQFIDELILFIKKNIKLYKQDEYYIFFRNLENRFIEIFCDVDSFISDVTPMARYVMVSYITVISQMARDGESLFNEKNIKLLQKLWESVLNPKCWTLNRTIT